MLCRIEVVIGKKTLQSLRKQCAENIPVTDDLPSGESCKSNLVLDKEGVVCNYENKYSFRIPISDITGCLLSNDILTVVTHPYCKRRYRQEFPFFVDVESTKEASKFKELVLEMALKYFHTAGCTSKPVLVFVNPFSGSKKSLRIFNHRIKPMLVEANLDHQVIVTAEKGHAMNHVSTMDVSHFSSILVVSGDGIVYEVVNGLLTNKLAHECKLPIGIIPTGSGNGLAASTLHFRNEHISNGDDAVLSSMYLFLKGELLDLNIMQVNTNDSMYYSFLNMSWGLMANVDIDSEICRFLGDLRIYLWLIKEILQHRTYFAEISYLSESDEEWVHLPKTEYLYCFINNMSFAAFDFYYCPMFSFNQPKTLLTLARADMSRFDLFKLLLQVQSGKHIPTNGLEFIPVKAIKFKPVEGKTHLVADGELVALKEFELKVLPRALTFKF